MTISALLVNMRPFLRLWKWPVRWHPSGVASQLFIGGVEQKLEKN
jgi:hypothetical protein